MACSCGNACHELLRACIDHGYGPELVQSSDPTSLQPFNAPAHQLITTSHQLHHPYLPGTVSHEPDPHQPYSTYGPQYYSPTQISDRGTPGAERTDWNTTQAPPEPPSYHGVTGSPVMTGPSLNFQCEENCDGQLARGRHQYFLYKGQMLPIICCCKPVPQTKTGPTKHQNAKVPEKPKIDCPVDGCHRVGEQGFSRLDNLRQHRRNVHGEYIPKERRTCATGATDGL